MNLVYFCNYDYIFLVLLYRIHIHHKNLIKHQPNNKKSTNNTQQYNHQTIMQTVRNVLMSYLVKLLVPESPAYGNSSPFIKPQPNQQIMSTVQVCDIVFTRTNSSWYQICRRFLGIHYDHVSVVISKTQVIHISPPIISKLQLPYILGPSREPLIIRLSLTPQQKQSMLAILTNFIGEKYNQSAIPSMFKNQLISRIFQAQKNHEFVFQNLKYSKICTEAIMYAIGKGNQNMQHDLTNYVRAKAGYQRLGYMMPDQLLGFLETMNPTIVHKSQPTHEYTYLRKIEDKIHAVSQTLSPVTSLPSAIANSQIFNIISQITKNTSVYLLKQHPMVKILNIAIIIYELKYGKKFNKILLMETVIAVLLLMRVIPDDDIMKGMLRKLAKL